METAYLKTPIGTAIIEGDVSGVARISVTDDVMDFSNAVPGSLALAVMQLNQYFAGERSVFTFSLNPAGTGFQRKVWDELSTIPYGKTVSYMDVSKRIGDIRSIRAVASANGKNPLWIVVPCHRVIGTDGSLTGYAGGLWRKQWLLEHENPSIQQRLF